VSRVILSPLAQADLIEIGRHIAEQNAVAARKWVAKLRTTCKETIGTFPNCGAQCDDWLAGMRCFSVGSYVIYFKGRNPVRILRIVHGSRAQESLEYES
jgi:plasmid stabilization system protein ParE